MTNILAHHIIVDGIDHGFAIAHIAGMEVTVEPFDGRETHSTTFVSGTVTITTGPHLPIINLP